jgi:hypothetical protein
MKITQWGGETILNLVKRRKISLKKWKKNYRQVELSKKVHSNGSYLKAESERKGKFVPFIIGHILAISLQVKIKHAPFKDIGTMF